MLHLHICSLLCWYPPYPLEGALTSLIDHQLLPSAESLWDRDVFTLPLEVKQRTKIQTLHPPGPICSSSCYHERQIIGSWSWILYSVNSHSIRLSMSQMCSKQVPHRSANQEAYRTAPQAHPVRRRRAGIVLARNRPQFFLNP